MPGRAEAGHVQEDAANDRSIVPVAKKQEKKRQKKDSQGSSSSNSQAPSTSSFEECRRQQ